MVSKSELLRKENLEINFLKDSGFTRGKCAKCGKFFWSLVERKTCGDQPCDEYSFIGKPITKKPYDWKKMRSLFLEWFGKNGHKPIARYPVVSRWKPDTLFTGASIYCFQPWVLNKTIEPPENPLVMSQPSFRAQDLDNIGLGTARHMSLFEMMAHHSFNYPEREIYWKDRTVELCWRWMTEALGIDKGIITFKENIWEGGGYAGPCFEVLSAGAELSTLVFMQYEGPDATGNYRPLDLRVVDTGYGLERHVWVSQGTPTVYDSAYPGIIEKLKLEAGISEVDSRILSEFCKVCGALNIEEANVDVLREKIVSEVSKRIGIDKAEMMNTILPLNNLYQIADHAKALVFILGDGVVPSNVKEGYVARLLIRRALRSMRELGLALPLSEIVRMQIKDVADIYPELKENGEDIVKMVEIENVKYGQTLHRGKNIISSLVEDLRKAGKKEIDQKALVTLYDSHGLLPRDVKTIAEGKIAVADISDVETKMAVQKTSQRFQEEGFKIDVFGIPETRKLYYEDEKLHEFYARVVKVIDRKYVILNQTAFYPRGGGQEPDFGTIEGSRVFDAESVGNVIVHFTENPALRPGKIVKCVVDRERRSRISKHHTATHIVNGAVRKVLGNHVWQAGARKYADRAHLDITHYENLSEEQLEKIEKVANGIVEGALEVKRQVLDRSAAESKYGFRIYQGGAVPGKNIRIISVNSFDIEACGGIHQFSTEDVGRIIIEKSERIQDGVVRLVFVAGKAADEYAEKYKEIIKKSRKLLKVSKEEEVPAAAELLLNKMKERRKELEALKKKAAEKMIKNLAFERVGKASILVKDFPGMDLTGLQEISRKLSRDDTVIMLFGLEGGKVNVFGSAGRSTGVDIGKMVGLICKELGGKGGGSSSLGKGFGEDLKKLPKIMETIRKTLK